MELFVDAAIARAFVRGAKDLPHVEPRTLYRLASGEWSAEYREGAKEVRFDEESYYNTHSYGGVLAYARLLDVLGATKGAPKSFAGLKMLDFGYGAIGHLRILAGLGATVAGVDVDPMLPVLYAGVPDRNLTLVHGRYPADPATRAKVGGGYDLIVSKNTLKRGYVHPERPVEDRMRIDLGVSDAEFLDTLAAALNAGGWVMIYNICPAPAPPDRPFLPWSDGRSPFSKEDLERAGFEVIAFDRDDTESVRAMARLLGWDTGDEQIDIAHDLFGTYTLFRKPPSR